MPVSKSIVIRVQPPGYETRQRTWQQNASSAGQHEGSIISYDLYRGAFDQRVVVPLTDSTSSYARFH